MKQEAKKYKKLLYFKDSRMNNLITNAVETRSDKKKAQNKHYPYNCISRYFPLAHTYPREVHMKFQLPCGFLYGESWGALRKCWKAYKYAKVQGDELVMREYATRIQKIQTELGIPTASFPNLGMLGDIFFMYDKEKEGELRQQYAYDKVVCDKYDVDTIEQLVAEGKAIMFNDALEMKRYKEKEYFDAMHETFTEWANSDKTQEFFKANQKRWDYREKIKQELKKINDELMDMRQKDGIDVHKLRGEERIRRAQKRKELLHEKIIKESEISSVNAVELVHTDDGWKYCKEILKDDYRRTILYDHEPHYYLTDLAGHRLADYKEEHDLGIVNDPRFYRLYLEEKEFEKIYANTAE